MYRGLQREAREDRGYVQGMLGAEIRKGDGKGLIALGYKCQFFPNACTVYVFVFALLSFSFSFLLFLFSSDVACFLFKHLKCVVPELKLCIYF